MKPVTDVTSADIACNGAVNTWVHSSDGVAGDVIEVPAGASVITEWHHTLAGLDPSDSADPIDPSHLVRLEVNPLVGSCKANTRIQGPVMVYMAKVDSAKTTEVTGNKCEHVLHSSTRIEAY